MVHEEYVESRVAARMAVNLDALPTFALYPGQVSLLLEGMNELIVRQWCICVGAGNDSTQGKRPLMTS